jgi:hypothetical protein
MPAKARNPRRSKGNGFYPLLMLALDFGIDTLISAN